MRTLAIIGLAYRRHGERRQGARLAPGALDRRLQHQAIHHRRQHAHGIADRTRHAAPGHFHAAEDIAAADNDAELDTQRRRRHQIAGDTLDRRLIDAEAVRAGERLAGELDDRASVERVTHLERDPIRLNHCASLTFCLRMIFSENRLPPFGIIRRDRCDDD